MNSTKRKELSIKEAVFIKKNEMIKKVLTGMERGYIRGDAPRGESDLVEIACFGRQGFAIKGIRAGFVGRRY